MPGCIDQKRTGKRAVTTPRVAYLNARLLDPESSLDTLGALLIEDGKIADFGVPFGKGYFELCAKVNDTTHEEPGHCNACIDGYSMNEFNLCVKN